MVPATVFAPPTESEPHSRRVTSDLPVVRMRVQTGEELSVLHHKTRTVSSEIPLSIRQ